MCVTLQGCTALHCRLLWYPCVSLAHMIERCCHVHNVKLLSRQLGYHAEDLATTAHTQTLRMTSCPWLQSVVLIASAQGGTDWHYANCLSTGEVLPHTHPQGTPTCREACKDKARAWVCTCCTDTPWLWCMICMHTHKYTYVYLYIIDIYTEREHVQMLCMTAGCQP